MAYISAVCAVISQLSTFYRAIRMGIKPLQQSYQRIICNPSSILPILLISQPQLPLSVVLVFLICFSVSRYQSSQFFLLSSSRLGYLLSQLFLLSSSMLCYLLSQLFLFVLLCSVICCPSSSYQFFQAPLSVILVLPIRFSSSPYSIDYNEKRKTLYKVFRF